MKYILVFLAFFPLFAETHLHVSTLQYLPAFQFIEWSTTEFDENEKFLNSTPQFYAINSLTSTMSHGFEQRRFEKEEGKLITQRLREFTQFIAEKIVGGKEENITRLVYDLEAKKVNITVVNVTIQEATSTTYTYFNGKLLEGINELKVLEDETSEVFLDTSMKFIQYCVESTIWWIDDQGTPVENKV